MGPETTSGYISPENENASNPTQSALKAQVEFGTYQHVFIESDMLETMYQTLAEAVKLDKPLTTEINLSNLYGSHTLQVPISFLYNIVRKMYDYLNDAKGAEDEIERETIMSNFNISLHEALHVSMDGFDNFHDTLANLQLGIFNKQRRPFSLEEIDTLIDVFEVVQTNIKMRTSVFEELMGKIDSVFETGLSFDDSQANE